MKSKIHFFHRSLDASSLVSPYIFMPFQRQPWWLVRYLGRGFIQTHRQSMWRPTQPLLKLLPMFLWPTCQPSSEGHNVLYFTTLCSPRGSLGLTSPLKPCALLISVNGRVRPRRSNTDKIPLQWQLVLLVNTPRDNICIFPTGWYIL